MWWEEILSRNAQKIMQYINKFVCGMHCWQGPITCVWRRRNLGYPRDTTHQISNAPLPLTFLPTTRTTGLQSRTTHIPCFPPCEGISTSAQSIRLPSAFTYSHHDAFPTTDVTVFHIGRVPFLEVPDVLSSSAWRGICIRLPLLHPHTHPSSHKPQIAHWVIYQVFITEFPKHDCQKPIQF